MAQNLIKNFLEKKSNDEAPKISKEDKITIENELPFDIVEENIIKIKEGQYRVIVQTNAISLDDIEKDEIDDIIIAQYIEYINSKTDPFQIYIPSFSLDIREHTRRLGERIEESPEFAEWLEDDIEFQSELIEENNIIETKFYITYECNFTSTGNVEKDFSKAKKMLLSHVNKAINDLEGIGLHIKLLTKNEIGSLLYYGLNPFSAGIQEPDFNFTLVPGLNYDKKFNINRSSKENDSNAESFSLSQNYNNDYLKMGSLDFKQKIVPYSINDKESGDYIKVGSCYMTVYEIYDYPTNMPTLWGKKLYTFRNNIDISIHVKPIKTSEISKELDKAAVEFGSATIDIKTNEKRKARTALDKKMEKTEEDILKIMDKLDEDQAFFHYSMYVMAKARTLDELNDLCTDLENTIGGMRVLFRKTTENMKNALWTILPFGLDLLGTTRNMLSYGVANSFPFTNFTFGHKDGFFLGTHKHNMSFIHFNPFRLENGNGAILGCSGAGKSVTGKKIMKGLHTVLDIPLRLIDPEGEMSPFMKTIDGQVIDYFPGSKHRINVFDVEPDDEIDSLIKSQINYLKILFNKMLDLQKSDRHKLNYSLIKLYNEFGFYDDKETYFNDKRKEEGVFHMGRPLRKPPEIFDLFNRWKENKWVDEIGETTHLANQLTEWTRLGTLDTFDGPTNVDFKNRAIAFNLKHMDKYGKDIMMLSLYHKLWDLARRIPSANITEEAHVVMRDDEIGEYVYESNKRIRKYGGLNIFITQNITDYNKTKWGPEVLKNCSWALLMKQKGEDCDLLGDIYEIPKSAARRMKAFNRNRGEGYLMADNYRIPINLRVSQRELQVFKTGRNS